MLEGELLLYYLVRRVLAEGKRKVVSEEEELKAASGMFISFTLVCPYICRSVNFARVTVHNTATGKKKKVYSVRP